MRKTLFSISLMILLILTICLPNTFAQYISHTVLEGHTDGVVALAFSPDGSLLASAGGADFAAGRRDATIRLWNPTTGEHIRTLTIGATNLAFSPDGSLLAGGTSEITILWNPITGEKIRRLTQGGDALAFSPDGSLLASAGRQDATIILWNPTTGEEIRRLTGPDYSVAFSPDGSLLASGGSYIILWNPTTGEEIRRLTGPGYSVAFSPDGSLLAGGTSEITIPWNPITGEKIRRLTQGGEALAFSPDGSLLASGGLDDTTLWNPTTGERIRPLIGPGYSVAFSPDGSLLASGSFYDTIRLWEIPATEVRITPFPAVSPRMGEAFDINVEIVAGQNVGGYQVSIGFDPTALRYVESTNGNYLPPGAFAAPPDISESEVTLAATSLAGTANGDGTLVTLTFEVVDIKESRLLLPEVILTDSNGKLLSHFSFDGRVTDPQIGPEDVNSDGVVNILDLVKVASRFNQRFDIEKEDINADGVVNIVDLVKVAGAIGGGAAGPPQHSQTLATFTAVDVQKWLSQAQQLNLTDATSQRGILFLENLLAALTPKETALLPNYPNPLNPETWIPYQLAAPADVTLTIYAVDGTVVRTLPLGHQPLGIYQDKNRAAYWDGKNALGESVASGVYFYTLTAGEFTATRKMLIRK